MSGKTILVIGTYDTKDDELDYLAGVIRAQGGQVVSMDVSVLGDPSKPTDFSKHDVAEEGGSSIEAAIATKNENKAMQIMAEGAALLTTRLYAEGHPTHAHNRLITSVVLNNEERREVARAHSAQLAQAKSPTAFILPEQGCGEWDREGADLYDKEGLGVFLAELRDTLPANVETHSVDAHINDPAFAEKALEIFDKWRAEGVVKG